MSPQREAAARFELQQEARRARSRRRWLDSKQAVTLYRPLRQDVCILCGSTESLRPIYGGKLPGCCPRCWSHGREAVEEFLEAYARRTGKMKCRCVYCLGSGMRSMMPRIYCDCALGADLEKAERRREEEERRKLDTGYTGGAA